MKKNLESTLETLKNNLDSLSQKAFDVQEKINNAELFGKKKRKREVEEWLKQVKIIENEVCRLESDIQTQGFFGKFFNGDQAMQLNAKVHQLVEQSQHFGELLADVCETRGEELLTTNLHGKGFKANFNRIWNLLKSNEVSSIGIYGMGGVGKTALVKHINNKIIEKEKEKRVCWITVSQVFSIKKLQDEIADFIGLHDLFNEENKEKRAARLNHAISGKNITLILDDCWENLCLEKLGDPLHIKDCKLILTTRSFELCCRLDMALAPEVEEIAKSMAKVCDGLPLGIIVLAGSMRDETSIHVWRNELDKLRDPSMVQDDEEDEVFKVLKYSFDRLDSNHKLCFLRCFLYPEDFKIHKGQLVDRCISEELVNKRKNSHVKMHDLVRAMALKITKRKYMVISESRSLKEILTEGEWIKDLEKVSLMCNDVIEIPDGMSLDCPDLTTLICEQHNFKFISDSFFSRLDSLCFLNLSETNIEKLPNSLSNLEKLKSLDLSYCHYLVDIPDLGKLKKLKEFDLFATAITKLPQAPVEEIVSLKCLEEFNGRVENVSDLNKFFIYRKSQFVDMFHILVFGQEYERLSYFGRSVFTPTKGLSNSLLDAFPRLSKPSSLKVLEICDCQEIECLLDNEPFLMANLEYESRFALLRNLEKIFLIRLPNFIAFFQNIGAAIHPPPPQAIVSSSLQILHIWECNRMRKLGLLSSAIPNLEEIQIVKCNELEEIIEIQEGEGRVVSLPKLKVLGLRELPRLKSICNKTMSCDSIERIELAACRELKKLPLYFDPTSPSAPQTLKEILVEKEDKEWWESLEWEHPTHSHLLQPLVDFSSWEESINEPMLLL
ncbi:Apoptotic ATPase [Handroanthus impetiginosus]|uniref:Apoptotic ATPase n=1 Tax=Handroanthus impetiginosus TaxID=429701 RepID=A0A2G9IA77_9LAMI|nr:Apoptotic ATPase [Handroanthus impetiginosus]